MSPQHIALIGRLYAFSDNHAIHLLRNHLYAFNHQFALVVRILRIECVNEGFVDFNDINREPVQIAQR